MKQEQLSTQALKAIADGISEDQLLTPVLKGTGHRLTLKISKSEHRKITRGPGFKATVTDLLTGKRYRIFGRSCGLPNCFCDAKAIEVERQGEPSK